LKKIAVLAFITYFLFAMFGCCISPSKPQAVTPQPTQEVYPKPYYFIPEDKTITGRINWFIVKAHDGHEYLANTRFDSYSMVSYPECKLCKQQRLAEIDSRIQKKVFGNSLNHY